MGYVEEREEITYLLIKLVYVYTHTHTYVYLQILTHR